MYTSRVAVLAGRCFTMTGLILAAAMDLAAVDVERFEIGGLGDFAFKKRGDYPVPPVQERLSRNA